jgi:hypothetical protein
MTGFYNRDLNLWRPVVIICTTRFNIQQFYFLPTQCIYFVLCGSQNKHLLFPYTTLTGFYIRDRVCLLRGTDWIFKQFRLVWVFKRRPLNEEAQVQFQVSPCAICCAQSVTLTGFTPGTSVSPVSVIPPMLHTDLQLNTTLTKRTSGRNLRTFQKAMLFRKSGTMGQIGTFSWCFNRNFSFHIPQSRQCHTHTQLNYF